MRIIKLGGSLLTGGQLSACLDRILGLNGINIITPGGGEFADAVRIAQQQHGFDDAAAHDMALLAMQQMALLMRALRPALRPWPHAARPPETPGAYVWSPNPEELAQAGVPAGWHITSDSLAAWLCARYNAEQLIVVKSATVAPEAGAAEWQAQGVLDAAFHDFAKLLRCPIEVVNYRDFLNHD